MSGSADDPAEQTGSRDQNTTASDEDCSDGLECMGKLAFGSSWHPPVTVSRTLIQLSGCRQPDRADGSKTIRLAALLRTCRMAHRSGLSHVSHPCAYPLPDMPISLILALTSPRPQPRYTTHSFARLCGDTRNPSTSVSFSCTLSRL